MKTKKVFWLILLLQYQLLEVNILGANVKTSPGSKAVNLFKLEISGLAQLEHIKKEVKKVKGVIGVSRYRA